MFLGLKTFCAVFVINRETSDEYKIHLKVCCCYNDVLIIIIIYFRKVFIEQFKCE